MSQLEQKLESIYQRCSELVTTSTTIFPECGGEKLSCVFYLANGKKFWIGVNNVSELSQRLEINRLLSSVKADFDSLEGPIISNPATFRLTFKPSLLEKIFFGKFRNFKFSPILEVKKSQGRCDARAIFYPNNNTNKNNFYDYNLNRYPVFPSILLNKITKKITPEPFAVHVTSTDPDYAPYVQDNRYPKIKAFTR